MLITSGLHQKNPALHRPVWKCIFDRVCKETQNGRIGVNGEIIGKYVFNFICKYSFFSWFKTPEVVIFDAVFFLLKTVRLTMVIVVTFNAKAWSSIT